MKTITNAIAGIGQYGFWVRDFCRAVVTHGPPKGQTLNEAYRIGIKSLPILLIISALVHAQVFRLPSVRFSGRETKSLRFGARDFLFFSY